MSRIQPPAHATMITRRCKLRCVLFVPPMRRQTNQISNYNTTKFFFPMVIWSRSCALHSTQGLATICKWCRHMYVHSNQKGIVCAHQQGNGVCTRARVRWGSTTELTQGLYLAGKWWSRAWYIPRRHRIVAAAPIYAWGACKQTPRHMPAEK